MEKRILIILSMIMLIPIVSAINLDVSVKPVSDSFIIEFSKPAVYDLVIKNNGNADRFRIYSAAGVDISPREEFSIGKEETKQIRIELVPQSALLKNTGSLVFVYMIQNSAGEIKEEKLSINVINLADWLSVTPEDITPNKQSIKVSVRNILMNDFTNGNLKLSSPFFEKNIDLSLKSLEVIEFDIPIDSEKLKTLDAGRYLMNSRITIDGKTGEKEIDLRYLEQENIEANDLHEGFFIKRNEFIRKNTGNVKKTVSFSIKKDLISSLFTYVSKTPSRKTISGFSKEYTWNEELSPNEELRVVVKTNWLYPILAIILIVALVWLVRRYLETDVMVKKKVYYVKTKGGEFALRVHISVKARKFVERLKIADRIPPLVTLYDKFGAIAPDNIDLVNKRLEWNVDALNPGEERVFSYILYSKIGVVGRFELPSTRVLYEKEGEVKDTFSNKAFFINRPKHVKF